MGCYLVGGDVACLHPVCRGTPPELAAAEERARTAERALTAALTDGLKEQRALAAERDVLRADVAELTAKIPNWDGAELAKTEREWVRDGLRRIASLVGHDSPPYLAAVETLAGVGTTDEAASRVDALRERAEAAEKRVAELEGVLRPFAEHADYLDERCPGWDDKDSASNAVGLTIGDCRRARAALDAGRQTEPARLDAYDAAKETR